MLMPTRTDERRERAAALGPPIYGLAGQKALTDFGWHGVNGETTALRLNFGTKGRRQRLAIETTTEPVDEFRMLMQIVVDIHREHRYPLTIEERSASVEIDGSVVEYRILAIADDIWCGAVHVGDRWVFLAGDGVPADGITIEPVDVSDL